MAGPLSLLRTAVSRLWPTKAVLSQTPTKGEKEMAAWAGPYATYPGGWSADKIAAVEANRGWVYKCCSFLSTRVGVVPSVVRAGDGKGEKRFRVSALRKKSYSGYKIKVKGSTGTIRPHHDLEHVEDSHPLVRLLSAPNRVDVAADFWPYFCAFRYLCGVSYLWKVRDRENPAYDQPGWNDRRGSDRGNVVELWVLPATWITPRAGETQLIERYEVRPWGTRGGMTYLHPDDVIQWGEKSPVHPLAFYGPTQAGAAIIDVYGMLECIRYNALQNGADPGGVIAPSADAADLTPEALQRLAQRFQGRFQGPYNAGMPLILPGGWTYEPRAGDVEIAYQQSIDQARDYVMAMYDLDKSLMGFIESSTYAGPVVAQNRLKYEVIRPKHLSLAETLTEWLAVEFGDDLAIVYDDDDTGITDPQERRADIQQLIAYPGGPAITANELRIEHGFEESDDPEADKLHWDPTFVSAEHLDEAREGQFGGMLGEGDEGKPGGGVPRPAVSKALAAVGTNGKAFDPLAHPRGQPGNAGEFAPAAGPGANPTDKPGQAGAGLARAKLVREAADKVPMTDEVVSSDEISRHDTDAIEERMTDSQREDMDAAIEGYKEDWVSEQLNKYDPDEDLDTDAAAKEADWSDKDIEQKATEAGQEALGEDSEDADYLEEQIGKWYKDTRLHGPEAIDELADRLEKDDWDSDVVKAVRDLKDDAERDIEKQLESQRESLREAKKESLEAKYDPDDDRIAYLREFYRDHDEEPRFAGEKVLDKWGKDAYGDRAYLFETAAGREYKITAIDQRDGVKEVIFQDPAGSFAVTGKGGAHEVFTRVTTAVTALVVKDEVPCVTFTAAEPSRQKLYERLVRTVAAALPDYAAAYVGNPGEGRRYFAIKRDRFDELKEKLAKVPQQSGVLA